MPLLSTFAGASVKGYNPGQGRSTVTGGTLTSDATYYYRTFTSNGTLTITNSSLALDYIMVGGGGGGGSTSFFGGGVVVPVRLFLGQGLLHQQR